MVPESLTRGPYRPFRGEDGSCLARPQLGPSRLHDGSSHATNGTIWAFRTRIRALEQPAATQFVGFELTSSVGYAWMNGLTVAGLVAGQWIRAVCSAT